MVRAQAPKKVPRLCFLTFDPVASRSIRFGPFFDALRDLGYVDGDTIAIDYLSADGHGERFPDLGVCLSSVCNVTLSKSCRRAVP
jgi:putative tryptophan/tyrosine transport system substrate-binding protein